MDQDKEHMAQMETKIVFKNSENDSFIIHF